MHTFRVFSGRSLCVVISTFAFLGAHAIKQSKPLFDFPPGSVTEPIGELSGDGGSYPDSVGRSPDFYGSTA